MPKNRRQAFSMSWVCQTLLPTRRAAILAVQRATINILPVSKWQTWKALPPRLAGSDVVVRRSSDLISKAWRMNQV